MIAVVAMIVAVNPPWLIVSTRRYYVPIGNDDNTKDRVKVSIKTFSSGDTVEWLTWLKSFEKLIRLKGWGQDGPTLFVNARTVLRDMALDIFNAAAAAEVEGATPQNFNIARDVTAIEHLATMRNLSTLITTLPENDAPVSEKTLMYYFRESMPLVWQTKYEESGREASTLTELARYFTMLDMNAERKDPRSHLQSNNPRPSNPPKRKPNKDTRKPAKPATGKWFNYCELPDGNLEEINAVIEIADPEGPPDVVPATNHKCETIARLRGTSASCRFSALIDTGAIKSRGNIAVKMQLTEFGENRKTQWSCAVADQLPYAVIIGRDLIQHLGYVLDFNAGEITWNGVTVSIRSISSQSPEDHVQALLESSPSPPLSVIGQAEARQVEILDADYKNEPLDEQIPDYLNLPFVRCYLDDIFIITEINFIDNLQHLEVVLRRLEDAGLTINVEKCKFAVQEANFLGYRLTTERIAPKPEKVAAIQRLSAPTSKKELHRFIRTRELLPDQHGGIVSQAGKPLAFYSRKLTSAQKNNSVMEQELLSIASPAQLVFQRDMITDSVFTAIWATIYSCRQRQTRRDNDRENRARHDHEYRIVTKVLVVKVIRNLPKLAQPTEGSYAVTAVHSNGTLIINRGRYEETINQRRVKPFFEADQA
ncbi:Putative Transposase [Phytophthora palmivora]|uniref:Transposase n=1 Tax=Phytophthora palmivora TaxID=4796 RepID=A0A2P4YN78_9STRA|nr:Putative Transposase [Phytophthora palmivora]